MSGRRGGTQTDIKRSRDVLCSSNPRLISLKGGLRENWDRLKMQTGLGGGGGVVQRGESCVSWRLAQ